jgi:hypothetical protein
MVQTTEPPQDSEWLIGPASSINARKCGNSGHIQRLKLKILEKNLLSRACLFNKHRITGIQESAAHRIGPQDNNCGTDKLNMESQANCGRVESVVGQRACMAASSPSLNSRSVSNKSADGYRPGISN